MGVTFQIYGTSTTITLEFKQIDVNDETENEIIPIPNQVHYYVALGNKGSGLDCLGWIHSTADYDTLKLWTGQEIVTITDSTLKEFPVGTYWAIQKRTLTRKGGYLDHWEFKISLLQVYAGSTTTKTGGGIT